MLLKTIFTLFLVFSEIAFAQSLFNYKSDLKLEILVTAVSSELESIFGHIALRLQYTDSADIPQDNVISFVANTGHEIGAKKITKGIFGGYGTAAFFEPFEDFVKRNAFEENREIKRYILNSPDIVAEKLFTQFKKFEQGSIKLKNYAFFSRNCATNLYDFLEAIGFFINNQHDMIPLPPVAYIKGYLNPVLLANIELSKILSATDRLDEVIKKTGATIGKNSMFDSQKLIENLNLLAISDLNFLLNYPLTNYTGLRMKILTELKSRPGIRRLNFLQTFNYRDYPNQIYKECLDTGCAENLVKAYFESHSLQQIENFNRGLYNELMRSQQLIFSDRLIETRQFRHSVLLYHAVVTHLKQSHAHKP